MKKWLVVVFMLGIGGTAHADQNILRVHIESEPQILDPAFSTGVREFQILQNIFEGLTRYQPQTLKALPGVAEKWEISADGLKYTFHLRTNAKWSDNKPITAQNFWNSWERLLNPKTKSPYAFQLFYLKGAEDYAKGKLTDPKQIGMKVVNPLTFEVTLTQPVSYFLYLTSFSALFPVRTEIPEPHTVSNGAFVFKSHDATEGIVLLANPSYWGAKEIRINGVQFRPFADFGNALKLYGRTAIDVMADLPPQQIPLLKFRYDFRSTPILRTEYFIFNCTKPPFDKVEVRQAFAAALQRQEIADNVLKGGDLPYGFFVPPGMPGYQNPPKGQVFNPELAKQLLQKAGFGTGKPFPTFQIHYNNAPDRALVSEAAQNMWKKYLGVEATLMKEEWGSYLKTRQNKSFQISWGGWTGDYPDPNTFLELWTSDNRQNHTGWSNPTYDELIRKAKETLTSTERIKLFQEAEKILLQEAPIIPVLVKAKDYLIQPYVRGYNPNLLDIHPLRDVHSLRHK